MTKTIALIRFSIVIGLLLVSYNFLFAQGNFPTEFPDRIVLNATPDPTTAVAVTWRTNTFITNGFCELQPVSDTRISPDKSVSFKAITRVAEFGNQNETIISANVHSVILSGLVPGNKYIYIGLALAVFGANGLK